MKASWRMFIFLKLKLFDVHDNNNVSLSTFEIREIID